MSHYLPNLCTVGDIRGQSVIMVAWFRRWNNLLNCLGLKWKSGLILMGRLEVPLLLIFILRYFSVATFPFYGSSLLIATYPYLECFGLWIVSFALPTHVIYFLSPPFMHNLLPLVITFVYFWVSLICVYKEDAAIKKGENIFFDRSIVGSQFDQRGLSVFLIWKICQKLPNRTHFTRNYIIKAAPNYVLLLFFLFRKRHFQPESSQLTKFSSVGTFFFFSSFPFLLFFNPSLLCESLLPSFSISLLELAIY